MKTGLINQMQINLPRGAPFGSEALHELGISNDLANQYVRSGWLIRMGRGVFMHAGDTLEQDPTLVFLESRIKGLHVAAKSALARHGYRQNLSTTERLILWAPSKAELPDWFTARFPVRYNRTRLFSGASDIRAGLLCLPEAPRGPLVAEPELALLEMLSEVGVHQELAEARAIFESMRQIRTKQLLYWLEHCKRVKAVRLCATWAMQLELPWAEKVIGGIPPEMLRHRWVSRMGDGTTLSLPAMMEDAPNE
jgi:hypothetical protein